MVIYIVIFLKSGPKILATPTYLYIIHTVYDKYYKRTKCRRFRSSVKWPYLPDKYSSKNFFKQWKHCFEVFLYCMVLKLNVFFLHFIVLNRSQAKKKSSLRKMNDICLYLNVINIRVQKTVFVPTFCYGDSFCCRFHCFLPFVFFL